jgi:hypothetical protein
MAQPPPIPTARGVITSESVRRYTISQSLIYDPQDHMGERRQLGRWKGMEPRHEQQVCCVFYYDWGFVVLNILKGDHLLWFIPV